MYTRSMRTIYLSLVRTTAVYFAFGEHSGLFEIYFYEMNISRTYLFFTQLFLGDWTMTPIYAQLHDNFEANRFL